jgi:serine phosphatase RsbU (regulator of sigma subunit)
LGVEVDMPDLIREHQFVYESGSLLVLYTDGLIEFNHDMDKGEALLLNAAQGAVESHASKPAQFIVEHVVGKERVYPDDIAVLTIAFK